MPTSKSKAKRVSTAKRSGPSSKAASYASKTGLAKKSALKKSAGRKSASKHGGAKKGTVRKSTAKKIAATKLSAKTGVRVFSSDTTGERYHVEAPASGAVIARTIGVSKGSRDALRVWIHNSGLKGY